MELADITSKVGEVDYYVANDDNDDDDNGHISFIKQTEGNVSNHVNDDDDNVSNNEVNNVTNDDTDDANDDDNSYEFDIGGGQEGGQPTNSYDPNTGNFNPFFL